MKATCSLSRKIILLFSHKAFFRSASILFFAVFLMTIFPTAASAARISEKFSGSGYENPSLWTEAGLGMNEDTTTPSGAISSWGNECASVNMPSGGGSSQINTGSVYKSASFEWFGETTAISDGEYQVIGRFYDLSGNSVADVVLQNTLGIYNFRISIYKQIAVESVTTITDFNVSLNQTYIFDLKWDISTTSYGLKINGIEYLSGSDIDPSGPQNISRLKIGKILGTGGSTVGAFFYFDNVVFDTHYDYIGYEPLDTSNINLMGLGDPHWDRSGAGIDTAAEMVDYFNWANNKNADITFTAGDNLAFPDAETAQTFADNWAVADFRGLSLLGYGNHEEMYSDWNTDIENINNTAGNLLTYPKGGAPTDIGNYYVNIGPTLQLVFFNNVGDGTGLTWLDTTLDNAEANGKKVIVVQHYLSDSSYPSYDDVIFRSIGSATPGTSPSISGDGDTVGASVSLTSHSAFGSQNLNVGDNLLVTAQPDYIVPGFGWLHGGYRKYGILRITSGSVVNGTSYSAYPTAGPITCEVVLPYGGTGTQMPYDLRSFVGMDAYADFDEKQVLDNHGSALLAVVSGHMHNGYVPDHWNPKTVNHGGYSVPHWNLHSTWKGYIPTSDYSANTDVGGRYLFNFDGTDLSVTQYPLSGWDNYTPADVDHSVDGLKFVDANPADTRYYGSYAQLLRSEDVTEDDIIDGRANRADDLISWVPESSGASSHSVTFRNFDFNDVTFSDSGKTNIQLNNSVFSGISGNAITSTGSDNRFNNLTLYGIGGDGINPSSNITIKNTVFSNVSGDDVHNGAGTETEDGNWHSSDGSPLFVSSSDFHLQSTSPLIDSGVDISGYTADIEGSSIYGLPDIGAYEYQPPYDMGTDEVDIASNVRVYGDGKFRNVATASGTTADLSVIPQGSQTTKWLDISKADDESSIIWEANHKKWKESSTTLDATTTLHTIGDLTAGKSYSLRIDNVLAVVNITGDNCSNGICTANEFGKITFTYTGGYSEHTFDIDDDIAPVLTITSPETGSTVSGDDTITFTDTEQTDPECSINNSTWVNCTSNVTSFSDLTNWNDIPENDTFTLYMRDTDAAGNVGTANVANLTKADTQAPVRSGGSPSGELSSTTTSATLSLTTSESATCKYATASGTNYADMTNELETANGTTHTGSISSLSSGNSYNYYVRCQDLSNNTNDTDYLLSFSIAIPNTDEDTDNNTDDEKDLNIHNVKASSTANSITLTWKTDHNTKSTVRYGTDKNLKEKKKDNDKEKKHKVILKDLLPNTKYYFRIKTEDSDDNEDASKIHSIETKKVSTEVSTPVSTDATVSQNSESKNDSMPNGRQASDTAPNICSYTVESGDTLWNIAKKVYGDATAYPRIIDKNKDKYPNLESKLSIGQELSFGCADDKADNFNQPKQESTLTPEETQPAKSGFVWWQPWTWF